MALHHGSNVVLVRVQMTKAVKVGLWRRVALAEVDASVGVVCAWLCDSGGSSSVGTLVHS